MTFDEVLAGIINLLQREGRISYRALKIRFQLDDEYIEALKDELIAAKQLATDEDGKVLVWVGASPAPSAKAQAQSLPKFPAGERRQLTVMFCDLVGSTALSAQLDPEELQEIVRIYQQTCAEIVERHEGYIAQYLGDGLLVYFGYPIAHEDDGRRAVRTGLEIVETLQNRACQQTAPLSLSHRRGADFLQVRIGIHTGLVVVGEMGGGDRREQLALGETPNLAARLQGAAAPNTVVISASTAHLVQGYFTVQELGARSFKGISHPTLLYQVLRESGLRSRLQVARTTGLTPLVAREQEVDLLIQRWEQVKEGQGHGVLICGEPGIGKSRLVQALTEHVMREPHARLVCRGSPYHRHSALYPVIDLLERVLEFQRDDLPEQKLDKLENNLARFSALSSDAHACIASLLSLPTTRAPLSALPPQRLRQKTLEALLAWLLAGANQQPLLVVVEDLHWVDPSTIELISLLIDQLPTARILALLTFRPEFSPPWPLRSYMTTLSVSRLGRRHVETMAANVAGGNTLPPQVVRRLMKTTDGVPLFVEEFTKMIVESGSLQLKDGQYELTGPLPTVVIPATLHDSLMARLDRLSTVKEVAQLGATIGREFPYEVLRAISPLDDGILQQELEKLVEADLLYQHGFPPQATYVFKHALIREAAYQSLLRSTRQQHHRQIAQVLLERFPELADTQPELLAHHYTEADLLPQAIPMWLKAGRKAIARFANEEAISHFGKGRELLALLPTTPERIRQEIELCVTLGGPLIVTKGYAAPEVAAVYTRARALCGQIGETPEAFPALLGLCAFYVVRAEVQTALELAEQALKIARGAQERSLLLAAHSTIGVPLFWAGDLAKAREHWEEGLTLYEPQRDRLYFGIQDFGITCHCYVAMAFWLLGYPDQATKHNAEALALAQQLSHPFSQAWAVGWAARRSRHLRDSRAVQQQAETLLTLATEYGFSQFAAHATILKGWALADYGCTEEGITLMRQGLEAMRITGAELSRPWFLSLLAETYGKNGQFEEGLEVLTEALALVQQSGERASEPELHRLRGEFLLGAERRSD
ncbi:MAG: adenylate/guanylate cyclase domain-containing protein [Candidatus Binatia bacterium]